MSGFIAEPFEVKMRRRRRIKDLRKLIAEALARGDNAEVACLEAELFYLEMRDRALY